MPLTIPVELKKITPYVRRAEELDKDKTNAESRLVAYYCRQYAVHNGISLATSASGKTCLGELLNELEQEKEAMNSFTRDEAKFLCRKFAEKIFDKADLEDRNGEATKTTAKTFYAAASFLDILNQFYKDDGNNDEDCEELVEIKKRSVYGKWKATEILKAFKEGRRPTPGGYGEDEPVSDEDVEPAPDGGSGGTGDDQPLSEPAAPLVRLPSTDDAAFNAASSELNDRNEGTPQVNADLGPPPVYDFVPPPTVPAPVLRPPISPAAPAPALPPTFAAPKPTPASPAKKSTGIFGFGKKKNTVSKAEFADAMELTKFAMAAMEDKDSDLASQRLRQALEILTRQK